MRDSLGVPLQPSESKLIATTWNNEPLYNGDEVYETPSGDYVLADELQEWVEHNIGKSFELWKEDL